MKDMTNQSNVAPERKKERSFPGSTGQGAGVMDSPIIVSVEREGVIRKKWLHINMQTPNTKPQPLFKTELKEGASTMG